MGTAHFRIRGGDLTVRVIGADGRVKEAPPAESDAQRWNALAACNDDVSDLLDHFGRADNWYEIYKTIEFCGIVIGRGQKRMHSLWRALRDLGKEAEALYTSANYYRHARTHRPNKLHSLAEAKPILDAVVRRTLDIV